MVFGRSFEESILQKGSLEGFLRCMERRWGDRDYGLFRGCEVLGFVCEMFNSGGVAFLEGERWGLRERERLRLSEETELESSDLSASLFLFFPLFFPPLPFLFLDISSVERERSEGSLFSFRKSLLERSSETWGIAPEQRAGNANGKMAWKRIGGKDSVAAGGRQS